MILTLVRCAHCGRPVFELFPVVGVVIRVRCKSCQGFSLVSVKFANMIDVAAIRRDTLKEAVVET